MQTCLIADESSVIRKVASRILFQLDFQVESVGSGAEALALIGPDAMPDFVIVAATLPDMSGEALVRAIRALPNGKDTTILASLVEANLGQMTRLKRAGATGFIYKPFDRAALTEWIEPYLKTAA